MRLKSFTGVAIAVLLGLGGVTIAAQRATNNNAANAVEPDGTTPLHRAVHRNDLKAADGLIRGGADVNASNRYGVPPLSLAATNGNAAMLELLLKAGANPNAAQAEGETVLMTAARTGVAAAVKTLARPWRRREREGKLARADGLDVGGGRRTCRSRTSAARGGCAD